MRKLVMAFILAPALALVALASDVRVEDAAICTDVVDRTPVNPGNEFDPAVGKLFCFTRILGALGETKVTHTWFLGDEQIAVVDLRVGSPNWRTWSSKIIKPGWEGPMRVEIRDAEGNLLETMEFSLVRPKTDDSGTDDSGSGTEGQGYEEDYPDTGEPMPGDTSG